MMRANKFTAGLGLFYPKQISTIEARLEVL